MLTINEEATLNSFFHNYYEPYFSFIFSGKGFKYAIFKIPRSLHHFTNLPQTSLLKKVS